MNINKKIIVLFLSLLILLLLFSCEYNPAVSPLDDSRFNGVFNYYRHWEDMYGLEELTIDVSYIFDGSNKVIKSYRNSQYTVADGWYYEGNYPGDSLDIPFEAECHNGVMKLKIWGDKHNDWLEINKYIFNENGKELTFTELLNSDKTTTYNKIE